MKRFVFGFVIITVLNLTAFADVRLPDTPKPAAKTAGTIDSNMVIRLSDDATETKLVIPKNKLKEIRAALEEADNGSDASAAATNSGETFTRSQTIVSGLFMSLALIFGGVWFASRSRKTETNTGKTIVAGAVLFLVGSMATLVFANAGPPSALRRINGNLFNKKVFGGWSYASGKVLIEVSNTSNSVELIVSDKKDDAKDE